ncbi:MAG: MoaD/ThiS family protein [SAR202 cluster bacterium]|nr:MoaD/ThiS family protein [SAR202 cluster bacterium]RZP17597.1 MAG: hypothetical protein EVA33_01715 [Chloroflexota bacterium]
MQERFWRFCNLAKVFLPYQLKKATNNEDFIDVKGKTLREVIDNLEEMFPGTKEHLVEEERIKPGLAAICGFSATRKGLLQELEPDTEVHFLPSIAGG